MVCTMLGRRIGTGLGVLALVLMVGLSGCGEDNTPTEYNTLTQQNFVELCTNHLYTSNGTVSAINASSASTLDPALSSTDSTIQSDTQASSESACLCMYAVFVDQMPIADFTTLNSDLKSDPEKTWNGVSSSIKDALGKCASSTSGSSSSTTAPTSSTTVAG